MNKVQKHILDSKSNKKPIVKLSLKKILKILKAIWSMINSILEKK